MLARAGLHVGVSTVRRLLERTTPPQGQQTAVDAGQSQNVDEAPNEGTDEGAAEGEPTPGPEAKSQAVRADRPNQIWEIDFTLVPTAGGFWMPWIPNALLQRWPFCWWVALVIDVYSRRVMGLSVFSDQPSATAVCSFLEHTITSAAAKPKYLVQDKGGQFTSEEYRTWCAKHEITPRFASVTPHRVEDDCAQASENVERRANRAKHERLIAIGASCFVERNEFRSSMPALGWGPRNRNDFRSTNDCAPAIVRACTPRATDP
ncbi:MAG: transposase family protein, partial [Deltaproteobacteria bacterium]|nr:transposase family protein [Deltaproteobacteria bacterium]